MRPPSRAITTPTARPGSMPRSASVKSPGSRSERSSMLTNTSPGPMPAWSAGLPGATWTTITPTDQYPLRSRQSSLRRRVVTPSHAPRPAASASSLREIGHRAVSASSATPIPLPRPFPNFPMDADPPPFAFPWLVPGSDALAPIASHRTYLSLPAQTRMDPSLSPDRRPKSRFGDWRTTNPSVTRLVREPAPGGGGVEPPPRGRLASGHV